MQIYLARHALAMEGTPYNSCSSAHWKSRCRPQSTSVPFPRNLPRRCRSFANNDVVHGRLIMKRPQKSAPFRTSFPGHGNDLASRIPPLMILRTPKKLQLPSLPRLSFHECKAVQTREKVALINSHWSRIICPSCLLAGHITTPMTP